MERRNDVGGKIAFSIMSAIVLLMFGSFLNTAWSLANDGKKEAEGVSIRESILESKFDSFQNDLSEIKSLLHRAIPEDRK